MEPDFPPPPRELGALVARVDDKGRPLPPRGADRNETLAALATLVDGDVDRWPNTLDPAADTGSQNNRRHEAYLNACEWPSRSNQWIARKGHPLTPALGDPRRVQWTHVYSLDGMEPWPSAPVSHTSTAAETVGAADGVLARERTAHLLGQPPPPAPRHVIFGGGSEALDLELARCGRLSGESAPLGYQHCLQQQVARHQARGALLADPTAVAREEAQKRQREYNRLRPFVALSAGMQDLEPPQQMKSFGGSSDAEPARAARGYRPGSAAARRAQGHRPTPWPL